MGHSPLWVDLDGKGVLEIVNGKRYRVHELRRPDALDPQVLYRYEFDKTTRTFVRHDIISKGGPAGISLDPPAVDGDGDLDLVEPRRSGLYWFENTLIT